MLTVHWKYSNWFATWIHLWGVVAAPSLAELSSTQLHSQLFRQLQLKFSLRYLRLQCTLCLISPTSVLQLEWQSHHQAMTQWVCIQNNSTVLESGRQESGNSQWNKRGRGSRRKGRPGAGNGAFRISGHSCGEILWALTLQYHTSWEHSHRLSCILTMVWLLLQSPAPPSVREIWGQVPDPHSPWISNWGATEQHVHFNKD